MDEEKMYYNAITVALWGDPANVRMLQKKCRKYYGGLFGGWRTAYEVLRSGNASQAISTRLPLPDPMAEWEKMERAGIRLVLRNDIGGNVGDDDFPLSLREMHHPPLALYVRGELPGALAMAIVGTRRATPDGRATTRRFGRELAQAGFTIVSGLALGIDAAAHEGCLEAFDAGVPSDSKAIAVLAGGLDKFYPAENERLGRRILASGGAVISEYPLGEPPLPHRFLERNRIVCGLARGVLVVECPKRSGSLATAAYALQQNRDLFVVPGPIAHPNFFGSHQLIRQGAELVTSPDEILEAYDLIKKKSATLEALMTTTAEKQVLLALKAAGTPLDVDKIIEMATLEPRVVNQTLSFLLLKGLIGETETGYIIE